MKYSKERINTCFQISVHLRRRKERGRFGEEQEEVIQRQGGRRRRHSGQEPRNGIIPLREDVSPDAVAETDRRRAPRSSEGAQGKDGKQRNFFSETYIKWSTESKSAVQCEDNQKHA